MANVTHDIVKSMDRSIAVDRFPWERQPREGERAFAAFMEYRDLEPPRTLHQVATKLHRSMALIGRWSSAWSWLERAAQWDAHRFRTLDQESLNAINEMNTRHARLAQAMSAKIAARLQTLDPAELSPGEIGRWMQVVSMVERLARGEATERVDRNGTEGVQVNVGVAVSAPAPDVDFDRDHVAEVLDRLAARGLIPAGPVVDVGPADADDAAQDEVRPDPDIPGASDLPAGTA